MAPELLLYNCLFIDQKTKQNLKPSFSQELQKVFNTVLSALLFELKIIISEH